MLAPSRGPTSNYISDGEYLREGGSNRYSRNDVICHPTRKRLNPRIYLLCFFFVVFSYITNFIWMKNLLHFEEGEGVRQGGRGVVLRGSGRKRREKLVSGNGDWNTSLESAVTVSSPHLLLGA